jgi:peptidoglycan/LPS O-acetylase OafA/YrhL
VLTRVFSLAPLRLLGKYSYSIYVIHVIVIAHVSWVGAKWFARSNPYFADLVCFSLSLGLCFVVGALSWKYFESPILRLKRHF